MGRTLMPDVVGFEPHVALFGGERGDDIVRALRSGAAALPHCLGTVLECERGQISVER